MQDSARNKAILKIAKATAEIKRWEEEQSRWEEFLRLLDIIEEAVESEPPKSTLNGNLDLKNFDLVAPGSPPVSFKRLSGVMADTERVALEIIKERNAPIHTKDLLAEIKKRGIEVKGKDPSSVLSARLSRSNILQNIRGYGWSTKNA